MSKTSSSDLDVGKWWWQRGKFNLHTLTGYRALQCLCRGLEVQVSTKVWLEGCNDLTPRPEAGRRNLVIEILSIPVHNVLSSRCRAAAATQSLSLRDFYRYACSMHRAILTMPNVVVGATCWVYILQSKLFFFQRFGIRHRLELTPSHPSFYSGAMLCWRIDTYKFIGIFSAYYRRRDQNWGETSLAADDDGDHERKFKFLTSAYWIRWKCMGALWIWKEGRERAWHLYT